MAQFTNGWVPYINTGMLIIAVGGVFWTIAFGPIQEKFVAAERRHESLQKTIDRINTELLTRRSEFPTQFEFKQHERRLDEKIGAVEERLRLLELRRDKQ